MVSEDPKDIYLTKYRFNPEDLPPIPDLLSYAPRIHEQDSGIWYHLNAIGVTYYTATLETHFQKGSPYLESLGNPELLEGKVL